jgi:cell division septation protein DedD
MATPSSADIAKLVGEIRDLKNALDESSLDAALKGLVNPAGEFDPPAWEKLSPDEQTARAVALARLKQILENAVAAEEPVVRIPSKSFMYKKEASNGMILLLTAFAVGGLVVDLCLIKSNWTQATSGLPEPKTQASPTPTPTPSAVNRRPTVATPSATFSASPTPTPGIQSPAQATSNTEAAAATPPEGPAASPTATMSAVGRMSQKTSGLIKPSEGDVLFMVMLLGALGGFLRLASSLANYVGNRQLLKSWIIYYFLTPIQGAALAPVVYLLLRVGVLNPANPAQGSTSPADSLNLIGIYAFAVLTGLFSKQAIEMLADVFSTIFKKAETKDALDKSKQDKTKAKDESDAS